MKKWSLIIVLISCIGFSQTDDDYLAAIEAYKVHYNAKQYDSIYNTFDESMQKLITLDVIKMQLDGLHQMAGEIESIAPMNDTTGVKKYKVKHQKNIWQYRIVLNPELKITGLRPEPYVSPDVKIIEKNTTPMILPFNEEWFVFWGGTEVHKNYHVAYDNQKYAYDILMVKDGSSYKGDPRDNESYYVFGKNIIAPCDAKVVQVITGVEDNVPGELNPAQVTGNTVVLETENKEYILFAHMKKGSIVVEDGQMVKKGDLLGQCGNSGNTTEPHLHLSLQNQIQMFGAMGGKLIFEKILVNGEVKENYLPEKGELIQNIKE